MRKTIEYVGDVMTVGSLELIYGLSPAGGPDRQRLLLLKERSLIQQYVDLMQSLDPPPRRIFELGIYGGGSTALIAELVDCEKLVAIELSTRRVELLDAHIEANGLAERVKALYGVDQGDKAALGAIADAEFGDDPIDLVIDDASHLYEPSRASFEVLFPRLRPGATYIIEDWSSEHEVARNLTRAADAPGVDGAPSEGLSNLVGALRSDIASAADPALSAQADGVAERILGERSRASILHGIRLRNAALGVRSLAHLALELVLARAQSPDVIDDVAISGGWLQVRRGPGAVDPADFAVGDIYDDYYNSLGAYS